MSDSGSNDEDVQVLQKKGDQTGCNPVCNTGASGRFCQEVSRAIRIGCPLRQTGAWAEGGLCAGKCMLNPCSNYDDCICILNVFYTDEEK